MKKRMIIVAGAAALLIYIFFPLLAGTFAIGRCDGPRIYFAFHHRALYDLAYEQRFDASPKPSVWYERPWFYGMKPKLRDLNPEMRRKWDEIPADRKPEQ